MEHDTDENEFFRLIREHPTVSFNARAFTGDDDYGEERNRVLVAMEPIDGMPCNWDIEYIKNYDVYISWNSRFLYDIKHDPRLKNTELVWHRGNVFCNHYNQLTQWPTWDERIAGICALNKLYGTGVRDVGDIIMERLPAMQVFSKVGRADIFSPTPWGGSLYQGPDGSPIHHSHVKQLELISHYRFMLAFECLYHQMWSYDFITERIFNAFKCKTIPVYWGGFNIEKFVPEHLFIDFRKFTGYAGVAHYMRDMSKNQWEDMTEEAYEFGQKSSIGDIARFEKVLEKYE